MNCFSDNNMIVPFILLCTVLVLGLYAFNVIGKFRRFAKMMNVFPGRKGTLIMGNVADFSNDPGEYLIYNEWR